MSSENRNAEGEKRKFKNFGFRIWDLVKRRGRSSPAKVEFKKLKVGGDGVEEGDEQGQEDGEGLELPIRHAADPGAATVAVAHSSGPRRTEPERKVLPRGLR